MAEKKNSKFKLTAFIIALLIIVLAILDLTYKTNIFFDSRDPATLIQDN
ncbi:MAG: hypothetical protein R8P61_24670 [Bacteroidia bacterium]|nr:hypothetical protein [Bacteroidia bacterium]